MRMWSVMFFCQLVVTRTRMIVMIWHLYNTLTAKYLSWKWINKYLKGCWDSNILICKHAHKRGVEICIWLLNNGQRGDYKPVWEVLFKVDVMSVVFYIKLRERERESYGGAGREMETSCVKGCDFNNTSCSYGSKFCRCRPCKAV